MTNTITFEPLHEDAVVPRRATKESAGYDLFVYLKGREIRVRGPNGDPAVRAVGRTEDATLRLAPGERALLPLGFKARLPSGFEAQVRIRSSWAFKMGLTLPNAPGTIDADYPDEWMVLVQASAPVTEITHGDRIAQAVLSRYEVAEWTTGEVGRSSDRAGGFGSTG